MRIAFLFLTRGGLHAEDLWAEFFAGADPEAFAVYAHSKEEPPPSSVLAGRRITEIVPTAWGTISLVRATLALLRAACADPRCTRLVLLSESCVPLYAFDEIRDRLAREPGAWMSVAPTPSWMIHQRGPTREFVRWRPSLAPVVPTPALLLKQQQWMVFDRPLAELHLRVDHTGLWDGDLFAPDEHYFVNVTAHEVLAATPAAPRTPERAAAAVLGLPVRNAKVTHVEWGVVGNGRAPLKLTRVDEELIGRARGEGCLFLRKVAPGADTGALRAAWRQ